MIRRATVEDAAGIAALSAMLGRSGDATRITDELVRLQASPADIVYVFETTPATLLGWIHAGERLVLGSGRRCEIFGLVVDDRTRARGTGRWLVDAVEEWARDQGLEQVFVRTNVTREEANTFYPRLGYRLTKSQHVYSKTVTAGR